MSPAVPERGTGGPAEVTLDDLIGIAEEDASAGGDAPAGSFWLVDPLDGTKEFLSRNGEFTINIARIEDGVPVLGVVLAPALGRLFAAAPGQRPFVEDEEGRREISV